MIGTNVYFLGRSMYARREPTPRPSNVSAEFGGQPAVEDKYREHLRWKMMTINSVMKSSVTASVRPMSTLKCAAVSL